LKSSFEGEEERMVKRREYILESEGKRGERVQD